MKLVKKLIKKVIISLFPLRKIMVFESVPDLSDNTRAVFDEMIKRGVNKKYKMVWLKSEKTETEINEKNVFFIDPKKSKKKLLYYNIVSKVLICCNRFISSMRKKQFSMYLSHGTTFKSVRSYYNIPDRINYCLVSGDGVRELMSYELNYDINRTVALGFPRNDILGHSKIDVKKLFEDKFEKIVVWYPTFRQHKNGLTTATENKGVPIIHDEERAAELNSYAKEKNMLIVIKPHFAQDVSYIKNLKLSNILLINDEFFIEKNISSYEFINGSDALITDYSSVYFDYTLCDKPVAAIWEDIEEYKKKPGLIENYEEFMSGAEKIYDLKEFISFLSRVSRGEDKLCEQRRAIRDLVNKSTDGKNACRVVDFILEKINYK